MERLIRFRYSYFIYFACCFNYYFICRRRSYNTPSVQAATEPSENESVSHNKEVVSKLEFPVRKLERFIPVTLKSLTEQIRKDPGLLTSKDKQNLESFVHSLDTKYSQRFYNILEETKVS